eukprot:scaffold1848_cov132-Skeletonema_menzelii.AAC.8
MKFYLLVLAAALAASTTSVSAAQQHRSRTRNHNSTTLIWLDPQDLGLVEDVEDDEELLTTNRNPATCKTNCGCPFNDPSCTFAACKSNCKCQNGGCAMPACESNCKCQGGNCPMPNCKSKCKCSAGGCEVENEEFLQAMEQEPKATGAMETNAAAVWGDEDIPECVHYSTAGDDQRACGPGAVCAGAPGNQGCDQRGLAENVLKSVPRVISVVLVPTAAGCEFDGKYPGTCFAGCHKNAKAKGCRGRGRGREFDEDEVEAVKTFLRSG